MTITDHHKQSEMSLVVRNWGHLENWKSTAPAV